MKLTLDKLKKGTFFIIDAFNIEKGLIMKLNEIGIFAKRSLELIHKAHSGSVVIKCNGAKYALGSDIAKNLIVRYA